MKGEKGENMSMQDIRPVDVVEYIYNILSRRAKLTDDIRDVLETMIVQMKDHTFDRMDKIFGIERE